MAKTRKPNLLFIFTDEQAFNTMKAYGNNLIETPNMDKLASESITFENAYVTQPVCTPSRSSLVTGLYPHSNNCTENNKLLPKDIPCFPELTDFSEYKTAYYGKWHLGDEIFPQHGFEDWRSIEDGYFKYYSEDKDHSQHSTYSDFLIENGFEPDISNEYGMQGFSRPFAAKLPEKYSKPAYLGNEASKFIQENQDEPFILFVNFFEPHMPYFGPRDDQYNPNEIPLPVNFSHELDETNPLKTHLFRRGYYEHGHSGLPLKTPLDWQRLIANYWGLTSLVDTYLGQILDTVSACALDEDTIIVYTSDHGDMMGSHRLLAKCVMFEEAVKVPLILKIPGFAPDRISQPVSQVDLVPTLLEAMGKPISNNLEGYSWMPFLKGEDSLIEEDVFIEWSGYNNGFGDTLGGIKILDCWREIASDDEIKEAIGDPVRTIITPEGWEYNYSPRGEDELYNLNRDPYEMANLAQEQGYADLITKLKRKICDWQKRTNDSYVLDL